MTDQNLDRDPDEEIGDAPPEAAETGSGDGDHLEEHDLADSSQDTDV
ncbi:hypothetical protein M1L60_39715 [Actinoplanes sp. TRM 88003]|uniref:Uncharacterized protein n=1 Tax=Paractinoplanes aksuensis TaxID=2939490 RepID=A0ABT1E3A4_9ACTN|nr:hypothetical protein [Actinoplanes aksuensis]MCO8276726.1 hypothetical protein [Actinoplanes aksuensis]